MTPSDTHAAPTGKKTAAEDLRPKAECIYINADTKKKEAAAEGDTHATPTEKKTAEESVTKDAPAEKLLGLPHSQLTEVCGLSDAENNGVRDLYSRCFTGLGPKPSLVFRTMAV